MAVETKPSEPRNIVLCFDGTGDWAGTDTTNVMKIHDRLRDDNQLIYYSGGVGTLGNPQALNPVSRTFLKLLDLASATSLRDNVLAGYNFLVENFREKDGDKPADRIFLFGFSRGAFTARLVASLVYNFGLLDLEHKNLAPYLWQTISDFRNFDDFLRSAAMIRRCFSRDEEVNIHFMGLFDTVSSVGIFERFKVYPYTDKNPAVTNIRHAVSIDEQRNAFPELLVTPAGNDVAEVWFPGVHRDVGGGAADHPGLSNETLNWMVTEADKCGLRLDTDKADVRDKKIHGSIFDYYAFVGLYPMKMFDTSLKKLSVRDPGFRWFWPNFRHERVIPIDAYVYDEDGKVLPQSKPDTKVDIGSVRKSSPSTYKPVAFNIYDFLGTMLGVALAVVMLIRGLGEGFVRWLTYLSGDFTPWPKPLGHFWSSSAAFWIFAAFVIHQGLYGWIAKKGEVGRISNTVIQVLLLLWSAFLGYNYWPWMILVVGGVLGFVVATLSGAGRRPILPATRAIGYFMVPWILIIIVRWLLGWFLGQVWDYVQIAINFAYGGKFVEAHYQPYLTFAAYGAAAATTILGLASILRDRISARPAATVNPVVPKAWHETEMVLLLHRVKALAQDNVVRASRYLLLGIVLFVLGCWMLVNGSMPQTLLYNNSGMGILFIVEYWQVGLIACGLLFIVRFGFKLRTAYVQRRDIRNVDEQKGIIDGRFAPAAGEPVTGILNSAEDINEYSIAAQLTLFGGAYVLALISGGSVWGLCIVILVIAFWRATKGLPAYVEEALHERRNQLKTDFIHSKQSKPSKG